MSANDVNIFSSTSGLNITMEIICHKAKLMLNADWATCFAPNSKTGRMMVLVNWGLSQETFYQFQNFTSNFTLKDFAGEKNLEKPILIDPNKNKNSGIFAKIQDCTPVERILLCPSILYGQLSGYLVWGYNLNRTIPVDAHERAEPFADQAALALRYNQLDKMARRQNARLAALLDLSTTIYSSLNYREVLGKVAVYSKDLVGADSCSIYIHKRFTGELEPLVVKDLQFSDELLKHIIKAGEGITGKAVSEATGLVVDREDNEKFDHSIPGIPLQASSVMSVPLIWSEEVLGAITLRKWETGNFSKGDLDILIIFARQAADAIENARLFESLEKAYNELSAAQEQLIMSEKLRALGEMAGGIAHDFNNMLGIILGRSQLLMGMTDDQRLIKSLKAIENAAIDGAETVRRIQEFTRVSSPTTESKIDINQVINDAIDVTRPKWKDEAQRKGIFIETRVQLNSTRVIMGNDADLREVISNLIINAIDALPDGGKIDISTRDDDEFLVIIFRDNGVGMDEETAKKIFFPFFTTKSSQGTGLGLAVTYGIITRHKGEISVESGEGQGSTFTIKLPIRLPIEEAEEEKYLEEMSDRKASVLVIDDDENIRSIFEEMLTFSGHRVTTADGGKEGLKIFNSESFDMVFTDLGMPEITGWEVAREIKKKDAKMPVILISGWGAQLEDDILENSGVDYVVAKPFPLDKILDIIRRAFLIREGKLRHITPVRI